MGLLERIGRLVRANLNELMERADDPRKLLQQVILDMENQLMQVKTQVAIAVSDQLVLEKKSADNRELEGELLRRAENAITREREDLARDSIEKALQHRRMTAALEQQLSDQRLSVHHLRLALRDLEAKLVEARHQADLLIVRQRRARAVARSSRAQGSASPQSGIQRVQDSVLREEATAQAHAELAAVDAADAELTRLERNEAVEAILREIRERRTPR